MAPPDARRPAQLLITIWWGVVLFGTVCVVFNYVAGQMGYREHVITVTKPGDVQLENLAHLSMLTRALKLHADEHDGKYPASIAEIQWRQEEPGMGWNGLPAAASRFHPPDGGHVLEWLYYAGHTESDPPDTILVASPVAFGAHGEERMVSHINNVTEVMAEAEFQRMQKAE